MYHRPATALGTPHSEIRNEEQWWATFDATNRRTIWRGPRPQWSDSDRMFFRDKDVRAPVGTSLSERWGAKWFVDLMWSSRMKLQPGQIREMHPPIPMCVKTFEP